MTVAFVGRVNSLGTKIGEYSILDLESGNLIDCSTNTITESPLMVGSEGLFYGSFERGKFIITLTNLRNLQRPLFEDSLLNSSKIYGDFNPYPNSPFQSYWAQLEETESISLSKD